MALLMNNGQEVETYKCPTCGFPLDLHFAEVGFDRKRIELRVGCSKCCWTEFWGVYIPREEGNRVRLHPRSGTASESDAA